MSSFYRQQHGRSRPPPARNRPGYHPQSTEDPHNVDPHFLAYLRSQAADINAQIAALSHSDRGPPSSRTQPYSTVPAAFRSHPAQVSHQSSSAPHHRKPRRNPSREGSKWRYYAVKNGLHGDDVYSSWHQAHPYCWDPSTQYFYPGCFCKGFDCYDSAWDFLLGMTHQVPDSVPAFTDTTIPSEPPEQHIPDEPSVLAKHDPPVPTHDDVQSHVVPNDPTDDDSHGTYDYSVILPRHSRHPPHVPTKVHVQDSSTNDVSVSVSSDSNSATPFITPGTDKLLPKYSATPADDINEFIYRLQVFLDHPSIDNCHMDSKTDDSNRDKSKNLATLLSLCISGNALSPFIDNSSFTHKGIEMLHHLMDMKHPISKSSASTIYNALSHQTIAPTESFESFAKRLRLMYKTCTRSGIPYDEGFLIRCFIRGLDCNFDNSRDLLDQHVLNWYDLTLNEVLRIVNNIKITKESNGSWVTTTGHANATGKQGAKRPSPSSNTTSDASQLTVDPSIPTYLYKPSDLTQKEVKQLLERYACPLCRKNTHPLHTCYLLKSTYSITLKSQATGSSNSRSNEHSSSQPPAANRAASELPISIDDEPQRYDGYECIQAPPSDSASESSTQEQTTDTNVLSESLRMSKINDSATSYLKSFSNLRHCMGSVRQCTVTLPRHAICNKTSLNSASAYPVIIDSGATHHMWNDATAFTTFLPMTNSYVSLANNYKIPIAGVGTIQLNINGYYLMIHDVYFVPSLQYSLYSVKQHRRYKDCSCIFDNTGSTLNFPKFIFPIDDTYDMLIHARSVNKRLLKIHWSSLDGTTSTGRKTTISQTPIDLPSHKPNPNHQNQRKITNIDLHKYFGFRTLKDLKPFQQVSKPNVTFVNAGELPLEHGDFATIHRNTHNKSAVERPSHFFDVAHMDIAYGDTVAPGGIKFALVVVDRKTRYNFVFPLTDCKSTTIINTLQKLKVTAGKLPRKLYTDFDPKLLSAKVTSWYHQQNGMILAAPPEQQHQNGLVERTWQTLSKMARAFINDKQMPRSYWYWAVQHASRVHNVFPLKFDGQLTTSHELVYKSKPDYRQLFRLFSTTYFSHHKDNNKERSNVQSHTLAGIAVGWSDVANGLQVYNPHSKELYTTSVFKIDEHNATKSYFNITYDGGMFCNLYSVDSRQNTPEHYPIGTAVSIPSNTGHTAGYVLSVPASESPHDDSDPNYTIQLLTGGTTFVPSSAMEAIIDRTKDTATISLPSWIQNDHKVRYTVGRTTHQGRLHLGAGNSWSFTVRNKLGSIIKTIPLPNLPFTFQSLINENILQPGWIQQPTMSAFHVSAAHLKNPCPQSLSKALDPSSVDRQTWLDAYKEEFQGLRNMDVYDEIGTDQLNKIRHKCGRPIPTMCVLTIKYKDGYPDRTKCRIVVLGNQQQHSYSRTDKFAPVISQNQFRCLLSLAISKRRKLRQGDVKNAFCNGILPDDEMVVIRPPKGCPFSTSNTYWKLKKTLYGLVRSPMHWYNNISTFFKSIGLQNSPNSPCVFTGTLIPGEPPIYLGLYVDDFAYFSTSDKVEAKFRSLLNQQYTVSYDDCLDWFLGMKFDWLETPTALKCHVHQEAFTLDVIDRYNLMSCNKSPRATPFRSGFPVDNIAPSTLSPSDQAILLKKYQQIIGDLNWLSISTRPDITTIVSLLSAHSHKPAQAHFDSALHVVRYLASTPSHGLYYTSDNTEPFHAFVHFPSNESGLQAYCDANWGPLDASIPKPDAPAIEQSMESLRSISGWFVMNAGAPIAWGCARHKDTAQSSCQAEVHSINETTKLILEFRLLFRDLNLPLTHPVAIKNDNQGAVQWSKGTTTKKMRWVDLRENLIRENIHNDIVTVSHIPGKLNLSDIFTKEFRDSTRFLTIRDSFMISSRDFSTGAVPTGSTWTMSYVSALTNS